ncbi:MAG: glutamate-1-semialdehyde 2,1-aminomutase [Candidatus Omnitrophica bacterium]|jgi:glutamate-1-semialdehyde 2,1-aminomutase|nr:glutamate-1-semialdehyde 2,1-aminomutase [Candidatus Omnitrophota bacterium]
MDKNKILFNQAKQYLVGGVNSPVRSFKAVGGEPIMIRRAKGQKIYDYDDKEYLDYVLSFGALILGHNHRQIIKDLRMSLELGLNFGATNLGEVKLAALIKEAIPYIDKIRFTTSGTEAVMGALRLARAYTKRDKIVKFVNSYHGHADYLLAKSGSGLASLTIPLSEGVPRDFLKHTIVVNYNDRSKIEKIFRRYGNDIAAVIVEPVEGNYGVVPPAIDFLIFLRGITRKYQTLLVFDEVITGFRFKFGSIADILKVIPDMVCLGKIIGGGLPIGAYGAKDNIIKNLAPLGRVYQASTFAGNPLVMQAGISTLKALKSRKKRYESLNYLTNQLGVRIEQEAKHQNIDLKVERYGSMFSFKFKNNKLFSLFYREALKRGLYFAPSEYEANFISFAHSKKDIDLTIQIVKEALSNIT